MSDEDCEVYELELAAGRAESAGRDVVLERRRRFLAIGRLRWRRKYSQVVPQLSTMDEFLAANRRAADRDRLLVVVAYAQHCKACKRIASKYRRLALKYKGEVDCYEVEQGAALPLLRQLGVERVPWLQVFDPDHATRLASQPAGVSDAAGSKCPSPAAARAAAPRPTGPAPEARWLSPLGSGLPSGLHTLGARVVE